MQNPFLYTRLLQDELEQYFPDGGRAWLRNMGRSGRRVPPPGRRCEAPSDPQRRPGGRLWGVGLHFRRLSALKARGVLCEKGLFPDCGGKGEQA